MLKLSEQEINKKLATALYRCRYSSERLDCQCHIFDLLKFAQSPRMLDGVVLPSIVRDADNEVDYLSELLYYLLTDGTSDTSIPIKRELMSGVRHAANRVIRNYVSAGLYDYHTEAVSCISYISYYYNKKGIKPRFGCGW